MFSYLSTPRSLYDSKHNNTSSLATACGDKPAHRCYGHVRVVARTASRTNGRKKFMNLPIPSPKHIIPNHPFYFFSFGKKLDGQIQNRIQKFTCKTHSSDWMVKNCLCLIKFRADFGFPRIMLSYHNSV